MFFYAAESEGEDDDLDVDGDASRRLYGRSWANRRTRRPRPDPNRFPKVPSEAGRELMRAGLFGADDPRERGRGEDGRLDGSKPKPKPLAMRILDRECASDSFAGQRLNQNLMMQVRQLFLKAWGSQLRRV